MEEDFLPAEALSLPPPACYMAAAKAAQGWLTPRLEPPQSSKEEETGQETCADSTAAPVQNQALTSG